MLTRMMSEMVPNFRAMSQRAIPRVALLFGVVGLMANSAVAVPVTYTGFTITDGKLGSWSFHNARVYLTFKSDTNNVQFIQPPICPKNPACGTVDVDINPTGTAFVTIISGSKVVTAKFAPNQISVSIDLGDTGFTGNGARGVGFGSVPPGGGFEPTYPLGIEDGTIDWGDILDDNPDATASPELQAFQMDLADNMGLSGRAFPCVSFLDVRCAPPYPLHTDHGDLILNLPYSDGFDSLSAGFFVVQVGTSGQNQDNQGDSSTPPLLQSEGDTSHPITYNAYVIADVTLGSNHYSGAQVYFSMDADTSTVVPFSSGHGFRNSVGKARVIIVSGTRVVSANFSPGQIYVYWDIDHASVGFGSTTVDNQTGYPLSITANKDQDGLVENSSVFAVSDLTLTPADASLYTPETATLATNLKNETTLSGAASSCIGFDPTTSTCTTLTPIHLKTNKGDFTITEPYRHDATANTNITYSVNWGTFWSQLGSFQNQQ